MQRIFHSVDSDNLATHFPYVAILPDDIVTPLQFNDTEFSLLEGTPLQADARKKRRLNFVAFFRALAWLRDVQREHPFSPAFSGCLGSLVASIGEQTVEVLLARQYDWGADVEVYPTFKTWLWASTAYTSRAFPPKMLATGGEDRSLLAPVLLPGIDAFNHARSVPVTWTFPCATATDPAEPAVAVTVSSAAAHTSVDELCAAITIHYPVKAGQQVFNCYGAKSNEEFLTGYGFVLPGGPDDTLTLVIGGSSGTCHASRTSKAAHTPPELEGNESSAGCYALSLRKPWGQRHYWFRSQKGSPLIPAPAALLMELRERLVDSDAGDAFTGEITSTSQPSLNDSWLLKAHIATPSLPGSPAERDDADAQSQATKGPSELADVSSHSLRRAAVSARRRAQDKLEALRLDGEVLETLESLLCAKRKSFKLSQKAIDARLQTDAGVVAVRKEVRDMVEVYREGQAEILDQAIAWTREKMDELVELIDDAEAKLDV